MRFRRRFAIGGLMARLLKAVERRFGRRAPGPTADATDWTGSQTTPPASGPTSGPGGWNPISARFASTPLFANVDRRFALTAGGVFVGTLVLGYLVAALLFFPAPILASSRSVPRVIGLQDQAARDRLAAEGLRVGSVEREPHPTTPGGVVTWQEPPAGVVAPEATEVTLTVSDGPRSIPVPDVAGYEADHARLLIEGAGLRVGSTESTQAPTPRNVVVNTRPPAGTTLVPGSSVRLVVSVGAATIRVPSLVGLTLDEARLVLETAGLALGTNFMQDSRDRAPGEIFTQEPAAGTLSAPGTAVNVRIARSGQ
jgi:beta-lactam-binding protein with PASTA domain